jgi:hypothetical protein
MKKIRKILKLIGLSFLVLVTVYLLFLRDFLMHWGSTSNETNKYYPGDSIVKAPETITTIATTIDKPPSAVWPWIVQMGLNKGGFYSYTWLENIFGCKLHNANTIHPEWQNTKEGDIEPVCDAAAKKNMPGWVVAVLVQNKAFVYRISSDSSWTMGYYVDSVSTTRSRLIARMRYNSAKNFGEKVIDKVGMEWAHCIMQHGSVKGIKKRSEKNGK